jgi:multiple sugar transport system permease protein
VLVVVITSILAFRLFDQVRIMTQGGPRGSTTTVMFEAVRAAFDRQQMAQASAMTVVLFTIVLALTLVQRGLLRGDAEDGE